MDLVADLERARAAPAIDLTADPAILTAIANDVGVEAIFARQVIAYGRAGDALVALSTSGGSANVISALAEARRRGMATIALVGYDGGQIAADGLADHVVVTRSQHIPRIQEAQASAYHVLCELVGGVGGIIHAKFRGIVGAMAMTGVRVFALHAGPDPRGPAGRLTRKQARGLLKRVPRKRRRVVVELVHWGDGRRVRDRLRTAARPHPAEALVGPGVRRAGVDGLRRRGRAGARADRPRLAEGPRAHRVRRRPPAVRSRPQRAARHAHGNDGVDPARARARRGRRPGRRLPARSCTGCAASSGSTASCATTSAAW